MHRTFATWLALKEFPHGPLWRAAALLFDELALQVPRSDILQEVPFFEALDPAMSKETRKELERLFKPIQAIMPEYSFDLRPPENADQDLDELFRVTLAGVTEQMAREGEPVTAEGERGNGARYEAAKVAYYSLHTFLTWFELKLSGGWTFLGDPVEHAGLQRWFSGPKAEHDGSHLAQTAALGVPDLQNLTWDQLVELRHHPHLERFRREVLEVQEIADAGLAKDAASLLRERLDEAMREIVKAARPKGTIATLIRGIATNAPVPLIVNPASIADSFTSIRAHARSADRFGWVYFVLDVQDRARKSG